MSFYHLQDSCVGRVCANMILKSHYGHTHTDVSNLTANIEVHILKSNKEREMNGGGSSGWEVHPPSSETYDHVRVRIGVRGKLLS